MISIKIPKGDLLLTNGTTSVVVDADCARQRIAISLDIFLGEWFLDLRIGIPYFRDVLIHSPNTETVLSVVKKGVMNTPGIVDVSALTIEIDRDKRIASVSFVALYKNGTTIPSFLALII